MRMAALNSSRKLEVFLAGPLILKTKREGKGVSGPEMNAIIPNRLLS